MIETARQLRREIQKLASIQPLTVAFERALQNSLVTSKPSQYESQKHHWLAWLGEYDGPGAYARKNWNRSAEFIYNHIQCAPMLIWLAEAAGVPRSDLSRAAAAALSALHGAAQCGIIRSAAPWKEIHDRLVPQAVSRAGRA